MPVKVEAEGKIKLAVNGNLYELSIEPQRTLAEVLREELGLTGVKVACDEGACGACTVLVDGRPTLSCMALAIECEGKSILTIEGMEKDGELHPLQQAFIEHHGLQCGFCTPGMIMSAKALLDENPDPAAQDVKEALSGNMCICGCQPNIVEAVLAAAEKIREGNHG
jgi:aerobic-type carbon monoxide dehydrogenase small subunit (CoxS/CutS family)